MSQITISLQQDELRLHMFEEHPKPGDKTVVFPSQEMDPKQLLATGMELKMFHAMHRYKIPFNLGHMPVVCTG